MISRTAHFSSCRRWRYQLRIVWDTSLPLLAVCGLNPSTADETQDDPTLRRVQGFARSMGRGGVLMLNAFAWRSTDPRGLLSAPDPVGAANTVDNLVQWIRSAGPYPAVAAWGSNLYRRPLRFRGDDLRKLRWDCFRTTKAGHPEHPLYLPSTLRPAPWNYAAGPTVEHTRREQLRCAAEIIAGDDRPGGATLGLHDWFAEDFLMNFEDLWH